MGTIPLAFPGDPVRQARFVELVNLGNSLKMAESLAAWQSKGVTPPHRPGLKGLDSTAFDRSGTRDPLEGVHPAHREHAIKTLAAQGVTDLNGKRYMPSLASFPFDGRAVVGSRHEVQKLLEERGWGSEGMVNTKVRERSEPLTCELGPYTVSNKIVDNRIAELEFDRPELAAAFKAHPQQRRDLAEAMKQEMSGLTGSKRLTAEQKREVMPQATETHVLDKEGVLEQLAGAA